LASAGNSTGLASLPSHATVGRVPQFLLPNLAVLLVVATLVYSLFVFGGGEQFFRDSDTGWHIRIGEWILDHQALPSTDPFSFSKGGQPWIEWEWGSDVLLGWAHRVDGLRGVTALIALAISACMWLCCRLAFVARGDFLLIALLAPPMITTVSLHWLARPHVFSWLFVVGAVWYAEVVPTRFRLPHLIAVAGLSALWANLHASFFLAPVIALIYAGSHFIRPLLWPLDQQEERARARWFVWLAVAAVAGSLLNPYGWKLHAHVFSYLLQDDLTSRVAEFQSFNFHDKDATQVALTMGLATAGGIFALSQKKLAHFLLAALFLWSGLRSARVLPLVALVILPLANGAFTEALHRVRSLRPPLTRALDAALSYSYRLRLIDQRVNGVGFCVLAVVASLLVLSSAAFSNGIGFSPSRFPVAAAQSVEKLPADARLVATDSYGGYLIYRFNGARKVFFDGRSDFYGVDFMKQYLVLISARPGWQDIVRSYHLTHALLPQDSALKAALEQAGWATLYKDDVATLLEAR
jgi:hypothetical protein